MFREPCSICGGDHDEGACLPSSKGQGNGQGRGRGRGRGNPVPQQPEESVFALCCHDFVDIPWLKQLGAMPFTCYVDTRFAEDRLSDDEFMEEHLPKASTTLRNVCFQALVRNEHSKGKGLECWFKEDKLPQIAGFQGRLWGGIQKGFLTEAEVKHFENLARVRAGYDSTRPAFTFRKEVKELLRGGNENSFMVRDYDRKASFPAAFLARHPWAYWVAKWIDGSLMDLLPGIERSTAKDFVNRCFGLGRRGLQEWCDRRNMQLPQPLAEYMADIRKGCDLDLTQNPGIVAAVQATGRSGQALKNAVVYILNSAFERHSLDEAVQRLQGHAVLCCPELDGLVLKLCPGSSWQTIEAILGPSFGYKPYRSREELLSGFALEVAGGPRLFMPTDLDWFDWAQKSAECAKRLFTSDRPIIWLGEILPTLKLDDVLFGDRYKTSPCSGKSLDVYKCTFKGNGYLWKESMGDLDVRMEADISKALCGLIGLQCELDASPDFVNGTLTRSLSSRLSQPLYDASFLSQLDSEQTYGWMAFSCGTLLDLTSGKPRAARPDDFVSRHVSYCYPAPELEEIKAIEAEIGYSLEDVLKEVSNWEKMPLNRDIAVYPRHIQEKLDNLMAKAPILKTNE